MIYLNSFERTFSIVHSAKLRRLMKNAVLPQFLQSSNGLLSTLIQFKTKLQKLVSFCCALKFEMVSCQFWDPKIILNFFISDYIRRVASYIYVRYLLHWALFLSITYWILSVSSIISYTLFYSFDFLLSLTVIFS